MTAKYTGTLSSGGSYQLTGKTWNGSDWVTETLAFEVSIIQPILKNMIWKARKNKSKRSTDGPITVRFIGTLPRAQEPEVRKILDAVIAKHQCEGTEGS